MLLGGGQALIGVIVDRVYRGKAGIALSLGKLMFGGSHLGFYYPSIELGLLLAGRIGAGDELIQVGLLLGCQAAKRSRQRKQDGNSESCSHLWSIAIKRFRACHSCLGNR